MSARADARPPAAKGRGTWALVPAKPLGRAKSRLAPALAPAPRRLLARELLSRTLAVLARSGLFEGVAVITRCPEVAGIGRERGALVLADPSARRLGAIVDAGLAALAGLGAGAVLVTMADLPLLDVEDVAGMVALGRRRDVVLAPDRHRLGTNAMLLRPGAMRTCFGAEDSFPRHRLRAARLGLGVAIRRSASLALDLDTVEDLRRYRRVLRTNVDPAGVFRPIGPGL